MTPYGPWISGVRPNPDARLRLFCFPHAGGGATLYRAWREGLPDDVEVCPIQLPGRETRMAEPPLHRMTDLTEALVPAIAPLLERPYAVFGHSLGGLIGFEFARAVRRQGGREPIRLLVSSRRPPQVPSPRGPIHQLPEPEFLQALQAYGGMPDAIRRDRELLALFLPILRADFALFETYEPVPEPLLSCPVSVFGGHDDRTVQEAELARWAEQSQGTCRLRIFPGNHFYLQTDRPALLAAIAADLDASR